MKHRVFLIAIALCAAVMTLHAAGCGKDAEPPKQTAPVKKPDGDPIVHPLRLGYGYLSGDGTASPGGEHPADGDSGRERMRRHAPDTETGGCGRRGARGGSRNTGAG